MKLTLQGVEDRAVWRAAGIGMPKYDIQAMREKTARSPSWVHFGAGNIFRAFLSASLQQLLDEQMYDRGVIACETYDPEIIDIAYTPYDNLCLLAVLRSDGQVDKRVLASVAEAVQLSPAGKGRMEAIFVNPSLQMVSLTVTEKAYTPENPMMQTLCDLLHVRYRAGEAPLAMVSMDNCAHNGDKLRAALMPAVDEAVLCGKAAPGFAAFVREKVSFPNTMIDKITPHPAPEIAALLEKDGVEDMRVLHTARGTVTAGFVNAEEAQYLVIEDRFPNGRPPLEKAGIIFTDRDTVDKVEKMKVGTCLNPLHTALAVLGCLLGYGKVSDEMRDADLRRFVEKLGYEESLPVVEDPGVLSPRAFLDEVLQKRVNNPFLPDTPQRIATDTSQKLPVRFSWTIQKTVDKSSLACVPFVFASWLRYLVGVDDDGKTFVPSPDPRLAEIQSRMAGGLTDELLRDETLFGADLVATGLAQKVRGQFSEMMQGRGAVRRALKNVIDG